MKKKPVIILILCTFLIFICCSCSPTEEPNNYDEEIANLTLQIGELQSKYEELQNKLNSLDKELSDSLQKQIEYQNEMDLLKAQVANLMAVAPKLTEKNPYFLPENYDEIIEFNHHDDANVSFEGFVRYCKAEYPSYNFIFLAPIVYDYDFYPTMFRTYSVLKDNRIGDDSDLMIYERLMMYTDVLGDDRQLTPLMEGGVPCSIDIEIYMKPVERKLPFIGKIELKFGGTEDKKFINIYLDMDIIATCYLRKEYVYVSSNWYENYFMNYFCYE